MVVAVEKPPFQVKETGWGEFDIIIKVYFTDPSEKPLTLLQPLKLYATEETTLDGDSVISRYTLDSASGRR